MQSAITAWNFSMRTGWNTSNFICWKNDTSHSYQGIMTDWLCRLGYKSTSKKKEDNFWSDFLKRSKNDQMKISDNLMTCGNNSNVHSNFSFSTDRLKRESICDIKGYRENVFDQIFNKKFEARSVDSLRKAPHYSSRVSTYHFCQK